MKPFVAAFLVSVFACFTTVFTMDRYALPLSSLELAFSELQPRGYSSDSESPLPFHGLLKKFCDLLKNVFTLHRGKLDELKGGIDNTFNRIQAADGKLKEYQNSYPEYPGGVSTGSCACPSADQIYEHLKANSPGFILNLKLLQLVSLFGQVKRFEAKMATHERYYTNHLTKLYTLENYFRPKKELNLTNAIQNYLDHTKTRNLQPNPQFI